MIGTRGYKSTCAGIVFLDIHQLLTIHGRVGRRDFLQSDIVDSRSDHDLIDHVICIIKKRCVARVASSRQGDDRMR